jgi:hypothetical protein
VAAIATVAAAVPVQLAAATPKRHAAAPSSKVPASRGHARDRLAATAPARQERKAGGLTWASFPLPGGDTVGAASARYSKAQIGQVMGVLGALSHGAEMSSLSVYVATPQEISQTCGAETMGCYFADSDRMVVSGSSAPVAGNTREHAIAHEYGHHIAHHRLNGLPWSALDSGTERWATYEHVCEKTEQGTLFPGNEGAHYWDNPGEGFAESYADLTFPVAGLAWNYSPLLEPDRTALSLVGQDVTQPWTGPRTTVWHGSLGPHHQRAVDTVTTPLDGSVRVQMTGPRESNFDVSLQGLDRVRHLGRRAVHGRADEEVNAAVCGQRTMQIEVRSRRGAGRFTVRIARP